jgi:hypothetical protein
MCPRARVRRRESDRDALRTRLPFPCWLMLNPPMVAGHGDAPFQAPGKYERSRSCGCTALLNAAVWVLCVMLWMLPPGRARGQAPLWLKL